MIAPPEPDVDAFTRRFRWILVACALIPSVPLLIYFLLLAQRLHSVENALRYRATNLAGTPVLDMDVDELTAQAVQGQMVYVPAYSHVYHQDGRPHLLTITLSVRNTSVNHEIVLTSVRYFGTEGNEIRSHLDAPLRLGPLATTEFLVERDDTSGGSGASFLVSWAGNRPVTEPIIESVMIDTSSQQGISFARRGTVVRELIPSVPRSELDASAGARSRAVPASRR